ncbi:MAG TPA: SgcJ/EcaC family oxidoreductase [Pyrinomonadaceae bacterium]|jgi:uncharacterized protein (TIGR02246 family)
MNTRTRNRRFLCVLIALVACALNSPARASATHGANAADEAAMRENVRQLEAGWNTKSGALFARPFAADADYVVINGMHMQGRAAIDQSHQRIFDTVYKNSTISLSIKQIRFLRPDVAVVHVLGNNRTRQGEETRETNAIVTLVMTKEKGDWKIVAFQNTLIIPAQPHAADQSR